MISLDRFFGRGLQVLPAHGGRVELWSDPLRAGLRIPPFRGTDGRRWRWGSGVTQPGKRTQNYGKSP